MNNPLCLCRLPLLATAALSIFLSGLGPIVSAESMMIARYPASGTWVEFTYDQAEIMIQGELPPEIDEAYFLEEVSPYPGWRRLRLASGGSARESAVVAQLREAGVFVSPLLQDAAFGPAFVPEPVLHVVVPYRGWMDVYPTILEVLGDVVSVRVLTSPLGTQSATYSYFRDILAPMPVEMPRHLYGGRQPPEIPGPRPLDLDGGMAIAFRLADTCGFTLFDLSEDLARFPWVDGASPNMMFRVQHGPVSVQPVGNCALLGPAVRMEGDLPLFFHPHHGLQFAGSQLPQNLWVFDLALQRWWFTRSTPAVYPYMALDGQAWYFYAEGTTNPRWFYDFTASAWITEEDL